MIITIMIILSIVSFFLFILGIAETIDCCSSPKLHNNVPNFFRPLPTWTNVDTMVDALVWLVWWCNPFFWIILLLTWTFGYAPAKKVGLPALGIFLLLTIIVLSFVTHLTHVRI